MARLQTCNANKLVRRGYELIYGENVFVFSLSLSLVENQAHKLL